jgi:hypothetical protein
VLRLAFDQNFPTPLIDQLGAYLPEDLTLAALRLIDPRLTSLDDRPLIIALSQLGWDGLVTNNYKMLREPREIAAIVATKVTVFAVEGLGHDPLRAAGAFLLDLPGLEGRLRRNVANVFLVRYPQRRPQPGWSFLEQSARRRGTTADAMWRDNRPSAAELRTLVV